jgi:hypothetical protein
VARLAAEFSQTDLVAALIHSHNPQDFTGPALPSGGSVHSQALSSTIGSAPGTGALTREEEFALVPAGQWPALVNADKLLRGRLAEVSLRVMPTSATGYLCLIESMLQMNGRSFAQAQSEAPRVQEELAGRPDALGQALREGLGLYADAQVVKPLATHIFGKDNVPPMLFMTPGEHGAPVLYDPLAGPADAEMNLATVSHRTAVFLETPGHYEPLLNITGRPWSAVLQQLQVAPHESYNVRHATWQRQALFARRSFSVQTIGANGNVETRHWNRGVQVSLKVLDAEEDPTPLQQAKALAEAQGAVDHFWSVLERWVSFDLGQKDLGGGDRLHLLGVSPFDDYQAILPRDAGSQQDDRRFVSLPALKAGETAYQYVAELRIREGRLINLTLRTSGEGDIEVGFDHPWSHPRSTRFPTRATLTRGDDLDVFDEFATRNRAPSQLYEPPLLAACLSYLHKQGKTWAEFSNMPEAERDGFMRNATAARHLHPSAPAVVRRALDPQRERGTLVDTSARASLHPDDLAAFDEFALSAWAEGRFNDPARFAKFLHDLRKHTKGIAWNDQSKTWEETGTVMSWEEFSGTLQEERELYMGNAKDEGHLNGTELEVVRRAIDPTRKPRQRAKNAALSLNEAHRAAYDEFQRKAREAGRNHEIPRFGAFLRVLEDKGLTLENFGKLPPDQRNQYLNDWRAAGTLDGHVPAVVRRALDPQSQPSSAPDA